MGWAHDVFVKMNEASARRQERIDERNRKAEERRNWFGGKTAPMAGGMVASALVNLINTSDLDQVLRECAPEQTNRLERIEGLASGIIEMLADDKKFNELATRYNELEKNYNALKKEHQDLVKSLADSYKATNTQNANA